MNLDHKERLVQTDLLVRTVKLDHEDLVDNLVSNVHSCHRSLNKFFNLVRHSNFHNFAPFCCDQVHKENRVNQDFQDLMDLLDLPVYQVYKESVDLKDP